MMPAPAKLRRYYTTAGKEMQMTFEQLQIANSNLSTIDIKGKSYAQVNERIKAFRLLYPNGAITTEIISNTDGIVTMKATVRDDFGAVLATGHAYEKEESSFINKTSYIENCETSAVGRALGMLGIGIDTSVASAEEMENAMQQQSDGKQVTEAMVNTLTECIPKHGQTVEAVCGYYNVAGLEELTVRQFVTLMEKMGERG